MRLVLLASMSAALLLSAGGLSGCATDRALTAHAPPPPAPVVKKPSAKSNRFEMTQNGRRMSAADFDAWMKARGIRIAKGPQRVRSQVRADAPKPRAKPQPKRR
ncbi:MAG: hypothetical protein JNM58_02655 [Xanthomonadaceae bacterium]|nr:hypothetical protein [Xanthomonadaceae bacterium]